MPSKPKLHDVYSSIIDSLNPNDLKTVVTRMKTTSKSFKNTILGDDNMSRMLSCGYFHFNDKYLITEPIILKKAKADKVTFCGMTLDDIVDFITNEGYLLYYRNQIKNKLYVAEIKYKNGVFLFDCTNLADDKYSCEDGLYAVCTCTLEFKNLKPTIKLIKTLPHISNTETLDDIINDDSDDERSNNAKDEAIHYEKFPLKVYGYLIKQENISKPKYEFTFEKFEKDKGVLITVIFKPKIHELYGL
jgi:hypothetical protein